MSFDPCGIITLLTDFRTCDEYVGSMKGVILNIFPAARIVDISHEVPAQDIMGASFILENSYRYFPPGSIHCVVVDPGVGTERKPISVRTADYLFVGPDNGVFSRIFSLERDCEVREISNPDFKLEEISDTFHGRDIFATSSAHLAREGRFEDIGPVVASYVEVHPAQPTAWANTIKGEVIHIDSYGNIITNISRRLFDENVRDRPFVIELNGRQVKRISRNYQAEEEGRFLALFGSSGMLEVSVRGGSAQRRIGAGKGDNVLVTILDGGRKPEREPLP
ncbi:MAG: hypothetical protein GF355_02975 [Candidatus Eisenbacteria bacterium]|nr:hypothetical protein [Candidatus Eisenbacteria bacterium]